MYRKSYSDEDAVPARRSSLHRDEGEELDPSYESLTSKRGRPAVPDLWTRVISLQYYDAEQIKLFPVNTDLLLENALPKVPPTKRRDEPWKPLFLPSSWKEQHPRATLQASIIKKQQLKRLCKQVIDGRLRLRERALQITENAPEIRSDHAMDEQVEYVTDLAARMQRGYFKGKVLRQSMVEAELPRETPVPLRRRRKSR